MNNYALNSDPFDPTNDDQRMESGELPSIWREEETECYSPLCEKIHVDVAVVGGGITGLTAAMELVRRGRSVALIEARTIGAGVSGRNSAQLTTVVDTRFETLRSRFDDDRARIVWRAGAEAIGIIENHCRSFEDGCDFQRVDGWLYSEEREGIEEILTEVRTLGELGMTVEFSNDVPLPFKTLGGMRVPQQAIFHPGRYLSQLAHEAARLGCKVYERSRMIDIESEDDRVVVSTSGGSISAENVIVATHVPSLRRFALTQSEAHPCRSYITVVRVRNIESVANAVYWDTAQPYHYTRIVSDSHGEPLLLVGGADHRTGDTDEPWTHFDDLERYCRERYDVTEVVRRWSAQVYTPADGLPYIGRAPFAENVHIATGYDGNGLTMGTISGAAIARGITGEESEYLEAFDATRVKLLHQVGHVVSEGARMVGGFLSDLFSPGSDKPITLVPGEGRTVKIEGDQVAIYRDFDGTIHALSAACRHVGCTVQWNSVEQSWDCPCHGGRYDRYGRVLEGPPTEDLECLESVHPEKMVKGAGAEPEAADGEVLPAPAT